MFSYTNYFRLSRAYYYPLGTNAPFFFFDRFDYTKNGLRFKISILGYSKLSPSVSLLVKLFVAEYNPKKGTPLSPESEDRLIIALFLSLLFIFWTSFEVITAIETQLTFVTSTTLLWVISE